MSNGTVRKKMSCKQNIRKRYFYIFLSIVMILKGNFLAIIIKVLSVKFRSETMYMFIKAE